MPRPIAENGGATSRRRFAASMTALVDIEWLKANGQATSVRLVEVDVDTTLYEKGHLPGAVGWSWTDDLNDRVRRDIASKAQIEALLSRSGIAPDTTVVVYGDHNNWFAAFAVWILQYYGHADVRLLDGGRRKLETERVPLRDEVPQHAPTQYVVTRVRHELRATREDVLRHGGPFIDVRSPDEYTGKILAPPGMSETALRGGHIPGAINVPWSKAVREDGTFRPLEELRALYPVERDVVTYCRIGERSSHTWFVAKHILGIENARNYDGSWTEYGNLIGVPIAVGPEPHGQA